jgi:hypothetical protein
MTGVRKRIFSAIQAAMIFVHAEMAVGGAERSCLTVLLAVAEREQKRCRTEIGTHSSGSRRRQWQA